MSTTSFQHFQMFQKQAYQRPQLTGIEFQNVNTLVIFHHALHSDFTNVFSDTSEYYAESEIEHFCHIVAKRKKIQRY